MRVRTYAYVNGRPAQMSPAQVIALVSGIFLLVGIIFASLGMVLVNHDKKQKEQCTQSVQAEIVNFKYNEDGLASPVYEYEYGGITRSFSNNSYSSHPAHGVGERVELLINPDAPQQAYVPDDNTIGSIGKGFAFMGFLMIGVAVLVAVIFFAAFRSATKQEQKKEEPWEM